MDLDYIKLVNDYWHAQPPAQGRSIKKGFCHNLHEINSLSIKWAKDKIDQEEQTLRNIENKLADILDEQG